MMRVETYDGEGNLIDVSEVEVPALPLEPVGRIATLLAVLEVATVEDAANAVGLPESALVQEALAWGL